MDINDLIYGEFPFRGFGFSGYRSFSGDIAVIAPLKKINFIIGKNNSGKSNIIRFLSEHLVNFNNSGSIAKNYSDIDMPNLVFQSTLKIGFPLFENEIEDHINKVLKEKRGSTDSSIKNTIRVILKSGALYRHNDAIWSMYDTSNMENRFTIVKDHQRISKCIGHSNWAVLWRGLTSSMSGMNIDTWTRVSLGLIGEPIVPKKIPKIEVIPAIREIGKQGSKPVGFSGIGIIDRLNELQHPELLKQKDKLKFKAINGFVRNVLENESTSIEIPHNKEAILVHMDGKTLPLESLGTGVHEVVILAAAATVLENSILCVEEPELHLHPTLQRKLIQYLEQSTNNQYIFTTHSAHLLDAVNDASVFHVTMTDGVSKVETISTTRERSMVCHDLGYKASDIMQANSVIWVEGPSDRVYLNYWIKCYAPELTEGVHYSIMFFGGRCFSHLTALDDDSEGEIDDLISVTRLNRNSVILFDSDKSAPRKWLNDTKKRLQSEFDSGAGFAWVTNGREVENYLDESKLEQSIIAVHPTATGIKDKGQWENLLSYTVSKDKKVRTANKVKVARHYIENNVADLGTLDLKKQIRRLCEFIAKVNA